MLKLKRKLYKPKKILRPTLIERGKLINKILKNLVRKDQVIMMMMIML